MSPRRNAQRGFTLAEMMVGMALSAMLMLAVLSAYIFLGRNLTRLIQYHSLESKSRQALAYITNDVKLATAVASTPTGSSLTLTLPSGNVTYTYDSANKRLTRTFGSNPTQVLLADVGTGSSRKINCTALNFDYYTTTGGDPTDQNSSSTYVPLSIKQIQVSFTIEAGNTGSGTFVRLQAVSARCILRNRQLPTGA